MPPFCFGVYTEAFFERKIFLPCFAVFSPRHTGPNPPWFRKQLGNEGRKQPEKGAWPIESIPPSSERAHHDTKDEQDEEEQQAGSCTTSRGTAAALVLAGRCLARQADITLAGLPRGTFRVGGTGGPADAVLADLPAPTILVRNTGRLTDLVCTNLAAAAL